jgi:acetyltransferase-like isoleucine patch superfamily enzyme
VTKIKKVIRALHATLPVRGHLRRDAFVGPGVPLNTAAGAICERGNLAIISRVCDIAVDSGTRLTIGDLTDIQLNTRIVAAGAVVHKAFPSHLLIGGVPARSTAEIASWR